MGVQRGVGHERALKRGINSVLITLQAGAVAARRQAWVQAVNIVITVIYQGVITMRADACAVCARVCECPPACRLCSCAGVGAPHRVPKPPAQPLEHHHRRLPCLPGVGHLPTKKSQPFHQPFHQPFQRFSRFRMCKRFLRAAGRCAAAGRWSAADAPPPLTRCARSPGRCRRLRIAANQRL